MFQKVQEHSKALGKMSCQVAHIFFFPYVRVPVSDVTLEGVEHAIV